MGVFPQCSRNFSIDWGEGLSRNSSIPIRLLQQPLGSGDRSLGDGKVAIRTDRLNAIGFGENRRIGGSSNC